MISYVLNGVHILFLLIPFSLLAFNVPVLLRPYYSYVVLCYLLTPLMWPLTGNQCLLTDLTVMFDPALRTKKWGNAAFSGVYMAWLYKPIAGLLGWPWDKDSVRKLAYVNWIAIFSVIWYNLFIVNGIKWAN